MNPEEIAKMIQESLPKPSETDLKLKLGLSLLSALAGVVTAVVYGREAVGEFKALKGIQDSSRELNAMLPDKFTVFFGDE